MDSINIFLSQPMSSVEDEEVKRDRERMKEVIRSLYPEEYINFKSTFEFDISEKVNKLKSSGVIRIRDNSYNSNLLYLSNALDYMSGCDYIVFHPSYKNSRGCQVEYYVADLYKIPKFIIPDNWNPEEVILPE